MKKKVTIICSATVSDESDFFDGEHGGLDYNKELYQKR